MGHDNGVLLPSSIRRPSCRNARPIRLIGLAAVAALLVLPPMVQSATGAAFTSTPWQSSTASPQVASSRDAAHALEAARPEQLNSEAGTSRWQWPIAPPRVVTRPFVAPASPYGAGHRGIDIAAPSGAKVFAPAAGVVHFAGLVVDRRVLSIEHPGGLISSFEPVATTLIAGTIISAGEVIGALESGHCAASCLHFGVRLHGQYVSPLYYLGGIPRSVLLPTRPIN